MDQAQQAKLDLQEVLRHEHGRRVVWRWLGSAGIYTTTYRRDSNSTEFNEGRRSLGLEILDAIQQADPDAYIRMQQEALEAARTRKEPEREQE